MSRRTTQKTNKPAGTPSAKNPRLDRPTRLTTVRGAYETLDQALGMLALCGVRSGNVPKGIRSLAEMERSYTLAVLACCGGNRTRAATGLGIGRATLHRRLDKYRDEGYEIDAIVGPVAGSTAAKLAHLPEKTRHVINRLVDLITINVEVEHIVLFGRHARPGGVDDGNQGDDSTIELLVLVDYPDLALPSDVWDVLEERAQGLARPTRVSIERMKVADVTRKITGGDRELGEALEDCVPLYNGGRVPMPTVGPWVPKEPLEFAKEQFESNLKQADEWLKDAVGGAGVEGRSAAVAYLREAAALLIRGALAVFTCRISERRSLGALLGESQMVAEKIGPPVPLDAPDRRWLMDVLEDNLDFFDKARRQISAKDLKQLREYVKAFRDRVVQVCREHRETLANATQTEPGASETSV